MIADEFALFREGMKAILAKEKSIDVVAESGSEGGILDLAGKSGEHIIILDDNYQGFGTPDIIQKIQELNPENRILVITGNSERTYIKSLLKAGAKGILDKTSERQELVTAIKTLANNGKYISDELSLGLIDTKEALSKSAENDWDYLSDREREVLKLIAKGLTSHQIADMLFISSRTVDTHRRNMLRKIGVKNTVSLVKLAYENEWFE